MKSDLISIIVPVYNGEKFIKNCVESIFKQTYKNFELLVINDGSTDKTQTILEKMNDQRLKIYTIENGGVSKARNYGLQMSQGEFVLFVDADDFLDDKALEILMNQQKQTNVDMIRFNGYIEDNNGVFTKLEMPIKSGTIYNSNKDKMEIINIFNSSKKSLRCYSPLLFLKKDSLIHFDVNLTYLEDKVFYLTNILNGDKNILFIDDCLYFYKFNKQSKTKNVANFYKNIKDIMLAKKELDRIISKYIKEENTIIDNSITSLIIYRLDYLADITKYKEFKNIVNDVFKLEDVVKLFKRKNTDFKVFQKIQYFFLKHRCFLLFYRAAKLKKKLKRLG